MSASVEEVLGEATRLEKEYEWLQASGLYRQALSGVDEGDHFRRGEVQEKIGHSLHRAAFQAGSREEFLERLGKAVEAYEAARGLYESVADERGAGWALRCGAVVRYLEHWIATDPSEKRRLLGESLETEENALTAFWGLGNKLEYGRTYNELSFVSQHIAILNWDRPVLRALLEKAIVWGEKSVVALSKLGDSYEVARAHLTLAFDIGYFYSYFVEPEKREQYRSKFIEHLRKAVEFSEVVGDSYTTGLSYLGLGNTSSPWISRSLGYYEKVLECGEKTQDIYLKVWALDNIAYVTYWKAIVTEDPDQRKKLAEEAMEFYDRAQHHHSIISFQIPSRGKIGAPAPGGYAEYYLDSAEWEIDPEKKKELLDRSEKDGLKALKVAEDWDIPNFISRMAHILSRTLTARARLETDVEVKRSLLEEAMKYRERSIVIIERTDPLHYWNIGVYHNLLADIKAELASIQPDLNSKRGLLEDAVLSKENGLNSINKMMLYWEKIGGINVFASLCMYQDDYGEILGRLYELTNNSEYLRRAIEIWRKAIESASKLDMVGRIAESYWKIANAQDVLGRHVEAADNFENAAESYMNAAEKIPQLKDLYQDYACYMRAWSEFEKAKQSHTEKRYMQAKEHYEKAAKLHKSTERWSHMAHNYLAWARLEEAEDLSRREETEEARDLFQRATGLFEEAKGSIEIKLRTIQNEEERELLVSLAQASDIRRDYCLGRSALEAGRILDRQGDHMASSRRYGSAVETFQRIARTSEEAQIELQPLVCLCEAWQKMTQAEAEASPDMYLEASQHFEKAKDHSVDERSKRLALGHSLFCRALEAGTRFEDLKDRKYYSEAVRHLESAASHYLRAGFESAAEYARGTQRLFDAYVYMDNASKETEPQKKARYYMMTERVLETSAGSYLMAKHPEKSEEVQRLLRRIREERELAVTLSKVLHAPTTVSTTEAFTAPSPTHEQAVGLDRFESADIQANFIARRREVGVGEDLDLEIELVNAGKAPAQLVKVEDIVIEGFELKSYPEICRVEDSYLDMKGRTLSPLKTQELKLVLKPLAKGAFELKPRILYLDEAGKYKSHEPEPVTITVQELGIRGWLRGPTR